MFLVISAFHIKITKMAAKKSLEFSKNFFRFRKKFSTIHGISESYFPPVLDKSKEELHRKIKEISNRLSKSEFGRKLKVAKGFYTLEMAPPTNGEVKQMKEELKLLQDFFKTGCYKHLTVQQAWLLFLVATEIGLWFFLGETIGKRHIVGYKV